MGSIYTDNRVLSEKNDYTGIELLPIQKTRQNTATTLV